MTGSEILLANARRSDQSHDRKGVLFLTLLLITPLLNAAPAKNAKNPPPVTPAPPRPISFRLDVEPVLFRAGCNSGGCHGAALGKDGFHLGLFGYDPKGDYFRLTQQIVGRRLD